MAEKKKESEADKKKRTDAAQKVVDDKRDLARKGVKRTAMQVRGGGSVVESSGAGKNKITESKEGNE